MSRASFFAHFDLLAEAPNGVKKLRELILQLAVQGQLVPQNPNDESVEPVISQYKQEKSLITTKKRQKNGSQMGLEMKKPLDHSDETSSSGWYECRMVDCLELINGRAYSQPELLDKGTPIIRIQNLNGGDRWYYSDMDLPPEKYCDNGDLLFAWSASFGPYIWRGSKAIYHYHIWKISLSPALDKKFAYYLLMELTAEIKAQSHGLAMLHMTKAKMEQLSIKLPPLAEQRRIVAKVDQLMALCDELEAHQAELRAARVQLNAASLDQLLAASNPIDLAANWQRIASAFDLLYDTPETVGKLRQAILQLAVQGRLVPQDPADEPASVLLERIRAEKERLVKEKKIKKSEPLPFIEEAAQPFEVPEGWRWVRFEDVGGIASNLVQPSDYPYLPHVAPDNIEKYTGRLLPFNTVIEDQVKSPNHYFFSGQILYSKIRPNLSKAVTVDFDGLCSADMYPIKPLVDRDFLLKYILSEFFLNQAVKKDTRVAMPKINQEELNRILVPLPPLAEQRRIVAKVDQLMALCDALEARLRQAQADGARLLEVLVAAVATD